MRDIVWRVFAEFLVFQCCPNSRQLPVFSRDNWNNFAVKLCKLDLSISRHLG